MPDRPVNAALLFTEGTAETAKRAQTHAWVAVKGACQCVFLMTLTGWRYGDFLSGASDLQDHPLFDGDFTSKNLERTGHVSVVVHNPKLTKWIVFVTFADISYTHNVILPKNILILYNFIFLKYYKCIIDLLTCTKHYYISSVHVNFIIKWNFFYFCSSGIYLWRLQKYYFLKWAILTKSLMWINRCLISWHGVFCKTQFELCETVMIKLLHGTEHWDCRYVCRVESSPGFCGGFDASACSLNTPVFCLARRVSSFSIFHVEFKGSGACCISLHTSAIRALPAPSQPPPTGSAAASSQRRHGTRLRHVTIEETCHASNVIACPFSTS